MKESVRGTPEERRERRIEALHRPPRELGRATSSPSSASSSPRRYRELRDITEELMGERRYRQSELIALVRARPARAEMEAALQAPLRRDRLLAPTGIRAKLRERDAQLHALIAELSATLTTEQRARLQKRIRGFLRDISTLTARSRRSYTRCLNSSVAATSRERMPGSNAEWPASATIAYSASGQARAGRRRRPSGTRCRSGPARSPPGSLQTRSTFVEQEFSRQEDVVREVVRLDAREAERHAVAGEVGDRAGLGSSVEHEPS